MHIPSWRSISISKVEDAVKIQPGANPMSTSRIAIPSSLQMSTLYSHASHSLAFDIVPRLVRNEQWSAAN